MGTELQHTDILRPGPDPTVMQLCPGLGARPHCLLSPALSFASGITSTPVLLLPGITSTLHCFYSGITRNPIFMLTPVSLLLPFSSALASGADPGARCQSQSICSLQVPPACFSLHDAFMSKNHLDDAHSSGPELPLGSLGFVCTNAIPIAPAPRSCHSCGALFANRPLCLVSLSPSFSALPASLPPMAAGKAFLIWKK